MATELLERLTDPRTREDALKLALDAMAMAADHNDRDSDIFGHQPSSLFTMLYAI